MPPQYNPLQLAQSLTAPPPGVFNQEATTWDQEKAKQAALLAQKLNNESMQVTVGQKQRADNMQIQQEQGLQQAFGPQADGSQPDFDPNKALDIAKKIAAQNGDLGSMLEITKAQRQYQNPGTQLLSPEQLIEFDLPEGSTVADAKLAISMKNSGISQGNLDIRLNDPNRELNADLKRQRRDGTQVRPMTEKQTEAETAFEDLLTYSEDVKNTYAPYISENRGKRFLDEAVNPNSPAARMQNELTLLATTLAAGFNGKRLSDLDQRTMEKLVKINKLDTMETVLDKFDRIQSFARSRQKNFFDVLNRRGYNTADRSVDPNKLAQSLAGDSGMDEETAYKEQYKAKLRAQRGG